MRLLSGPNHQRGCPILAAYFAARVGYHKGQPVFAVAFLSVVHAANPPFRPTVVVTQSKHLEKQKYMHRKPVVRELVEKPENKPWRSYGHKMTGVKRVVEIESLWITGRRGEVMAGPHPCIERNLFSTTVRSF